MLALKLTAIFALAALSVFIMNWLALIPWRRTRKLHWTEQARAYHPVRSAAASNLWMVPAVFTLAKQLPAPEQAPHWSLVLVASGAGVLLGTMPMDREVFPRISLRDLGRQAAVAWIFRFLMWAVFLTAIILMPSEFNGWTFLIVGVFHGLLIAYDRQGWTLLGTRLGWLDKPPERLKNIVEATATKMNIPVAEIWLMRAPLAQAYAMPSSRRLLFSERLLAVLTDEEIAAVAAHELAHLSESRGQYLERYVAWLLFVPWLFLKPVTASLGILGFVLLLFTSLFAPFIFRRISHKLEVRADKIAHAYESESGVYARALYRLHEDNLAPAVLAKENATHPHLYDRMLAAGVTPDFPRPAPPSSFAWNGFLFSGALGIFATMMALRLIEKVL